MICGKCQAQCSDTAKFCSECGQNLQLQRINAAPMAFDVSNGAGFISRLNFGHIATLSLLLALVVGAGIWAWPQTQERLILPNSSNASVDNIDASLDRGEEFLQPRSKKAVESITNTPAQSSSLTQAPVVQLNSSASASTATTQVAQKNTPLQSKPSSLTSAPVRITISAALASEVGVVRGLPTTGNSPSPQATEIPEKATATAAVKGNGWYDQFKTELSACNGNFFEREFCKQKLSWRHCQPNRAWGKVPECVENKTESHTR
jgi:hypothetical protein